MADCRTEHKQRRWKGDPRSGDKHLGAQWLVNDFQRVPHVQQHLGGGPRAKMHSDKARKVRHWTAMHQTSTRTPFILFGGLTTFCAAEGPHGPQHQLHLPSFVNHQLDRQTIEYYILREADVHKTFFLFPSQPLMGVIMAHLT